MITLRVDTECLRLLCDPFANVTFDEKYTVFGIEQDKSHSKVTYRGAIMKRSLQGSVFR